MDLTAKIVHPKIPSFITTIRYSDRADILERQVEMDNARQPFIVLDPRSGEPFIGADGEPIITWKIVQGKEAAFSGMKRVVVGWEGLEIEGKPVSFGDDNLRLLYHESLDVEAEVDKNGQKKKESRSWAWHLYAMSAKRETFPS